MNAERSMPHVWLALAASLVVGFVVAVASAADDPVSTGGQEQAAVSLGQDDTVAVAELESAVPRVQGTL